MKRSYLSLISFIIIFAFALTAFAACAKDTPENNDSATSDTVANSDASTESESSVESLESEGNITSSSKESESLESESREDSQPIGNVTESEKLTEGEVKTETEEDTGRKLEGENAELIELANRYSNGVDAYYTDGDRSKLTVDNKYMSLNYALGSNDKQQITSLKNDKGASYIENTFDVFVKMKSGNTYYASEGLSSATMNLYRMGYYYYDVHVEGQSFVPANKILNEKEIPLKFSGYKHVTVPKEKEDGILTLTNGSDPYLVFDGIDFTAEDYEFLEITLKCDSIQSHKIDVYILTDDMKSYTDSSKVSFSTVSDGQFHTYSVLLSSIAGYTGHIKSLRIDYGSSAGIVYVLGGAKLIDVDAMDAPTAINVARYFLTYPDKLHHYTQLAVAKEVTDIDSVGMMTQISADTVNAYVIKDATGLHRNTLDGVDFKSVEYVGFDIKDAGIFGYIIPQGRFGGMLSVTLNDGIFTLTQSLSPENGTISPSVTGQNNANDFYFGQRLYTSESHDIDKFVNDAEAERNPLTSDQIFVTEAKDGATFVGYDALRGYYRFNVAGSNFSEAYHNSPNKHYQVNFSVTGDNYDRTMYCMTYTPSGGLEGAVLLNDIKMLLPVPMEVCKNFYGDGDHTIFCTDDPSFGEVYFPIIVKAGEKVSYTALNLYQNWGQYPLKQLSSIQFIYPYYHLSTGVTESNCIVPFANIGPWLPDHRAMSAPLWPDQPQHTLGGFHYFLQYTDSDGNYASTENTSNTITSSGPTYAEVKMDYLSHDGRIKASYTHMEMPQTDENRTYYILQYEVLEDISFKDFKNDFSFYSVKQNGTGSTYKKVGYLDENNQPQIVDATKGSKSQSFVLGDIAPYFDFFYVPDYTNENGYVNLSFLISDYSLTIGGEKNDARFYLTNKDEMLSLSLNLGEVTLKKGDKITINAILMPWGSQDSIYDGSNGLAPDQNVRDVRENSILDPFKCTAINNCEVIESTYLPKIRTTNGKLAEFKISGGENNVAIRVYGFEKLTVPRIQEKIDGKWVDVVLSSATTPDKLGNAAQYDGYMVHYDGDGTFSYSFVTTLTGDSERTFRVVGSQSFSGWQEDIVVEEEDLLNVYTSPTEFDRIIESCKGVGKKELLIENDMQFIRIYGNNKDVEGHVTPFKAADLKETGSYIVIKYRIPTTNSATLVSFEIFTSTVDTAPVENEMLYCTNIYNDGYWHVAIIDVSKEKHPTFTAADDGNYYAKFLRLDFFDRKLSEDSYIDIAYLGMSNSLEEILKLNSDMKTVSIYTQSVKETFIDTATGEVVKDNGIVIEKPNYVHADSAFKESEVKYACCTDMINGWGEGENNRLGSNGSSTLKGVEVLDYGVSTVNGQDLILTGWTVVDGGVDRYVWSADGGLTWNDCSLQGRTTIGAASDDHIKSASTRLGGYEFPDAEASKVNCSYQGTIGGGPSVAGLVADLTQFAGTTVNVTFAAVPVSAPDTLCVIVHVKDVSVNPIQ